MTSETLRSHYCNQSAFGVALPTFLLYCAGFRAEFLIWWGKCDVCVCVCVCERERERERERKREGERVGGGRLGL